MKIASIPSNEPERLTALQTLEVLDTPPEAEFDALVRAASLVCGVPISLISLVDTERQWFKANFGLSGATETPRDIAFCSHAILDDEIFEVPNAQEDPRFADNPLVAGAPDIRFYAGAPLRLSSGQRVGTLCVIDRVPRQLSNEQREVLRCLGNAAVAALEGRRAMCMMKQITSDLQASEARFRELSDCSPQGVYYLDAIGRCNYTNERLQQIHGLTQEDMLETGLTTIHPEDRESIVAKWYDAASQHRNFEADYRILHADGSVRYLHTRSQPILDNAGQLRGFVGTAQDVTERHELLTRLQNKQQLLRSLYESTPAMLYSIDNEGRLLTVSDTWLTKMGYARDEVLGRQSTFFLTKASANYAQKTVLPEFFKSGRCEDIEYQMVTRSGEVIDVLLSAIMERDANGKPLRSLAVVKDITLRRKAEQALVEANKRVALATDSGGIGIWDWDITSNVLVWDNWMYRLYGLTPLDNAAGTYTLWSQHVHPDDLAAAEQALHAAIDEDVPFESEFRVIWPDGSIHYLRGSGRVTRDPSGRAISIIGANWDITQPRRLAIALADQHELLRVTLQSIGDAVITTDAEGRIEWLNPVAERLTGWTTLEANGRPLTQIFHIVNEETRKPTENPVETCLMQGKIVGLANHTVLISRTGEEFGIADSAAPIRNEKGEVLGVVLVFHDVTEQRRLSGEMSYRASHDALTGLINRGEFETRIRRVLLKAHEDGSEHALLYIDLDQFKLVNDACGHSVGDELLQQVSKLFTAAVRTRDTLARLGGDEFAIILEHCSIAQAQRVAQQICERMDDFRFIHDEKRFRIGASIGLVPINNRWASAASILQAADTSCYAAKEAGRNRVHAWFDTDVAMRTRHGEMQWTTRIERALDEGQFTLFAQRIEMLKIDSSQIHAEVLLRMVDEDGSLIAPGAFLPAAERFHLATRIDRWVLKQVITWMENTPTLTTVRTLCVNLSGQSVGDRAFHRWAIEMLSEAGATICSKLCLEITETTAVTNLADASLFIEQLRVIGVRVALDDFGAGASSFGYLKTMPVDFLKIDGQFIRDLITDPLDEAAVKCFIEVAKVVNMKTVAEFVEEPDVLKRLRELGVDFAQGYLVHKPEPIDALLMAASLTV